MNRVKNSIRITLGKSCGNFGGRVLPFTLEGSDLLSAQFNEINFLLIIRSPEKALGWYPLIFIVFKPFTHEVLLPQWPLVGPQTEQGEVAQHSIADTIIVKVPFFTFNHLFSEISAESGFDYSGVATLFFTSVSTKELCAWLILSSVASLWTINC
jgi:hypothetical protein